ncbi:MULTISPECIES: hypothetical protein [Saliphagus]|uniref:Uncharacterized protein n=1 Tax=Saliphagus infecundisoli TaxID=1849069 RepID=A0ABD5QL43_9EURY|nr:MULTISPECIES: hypothetical protein [Saliphagus]
MSPNDYVDFDSREWESWHWYVLTGYPVASLLGILLIGRLNDGGSMLASSLGSVALVIVLTAFGIVSLPAILRDAEFVHAACERWNPDPRTYVGAAVATPLFLGVFGALVAGVALGLALAILAFLVSTIAVCVVYLFNRHEAIGLFAR